MKRTSPFSTGVILAFCSLVAFAGVTGLLQTPSAHADSIEEEKRTKSSSSRQNTSTLACDNARTSAMKRAKLDCLTSGGLIASPEFSGCECNLMAGKALCSVTVTYECK